MCMYFISMCLSGEDGIVCVWDLGSGSVVREFKGHQGPLRAMCCSSDGSLLATGGSDHTVRLWHLNSNNDRCFLISHSSSPYINVIYTHTAVLQVAVCCLKCQLLTVAFLVSTSLTETVSKHSLLV